MDSNVVIALISGASAAFGSVCACIGTSKIIEYRIKALEDQVAKLVNREADIIILQEHMKGVMEDVRQIKSNVKTC